MYQPPCQLLYRDYLNQSSLTAAQKKVLLLCHYTSKGIEAPPANLEIGIKPKLSKFKTLVQELLNIFPVQSQQMFSHNKDQCLFYYVVSSVYSYLQKKKMNRFHKLTFKSTLYPEEKESNKWYKITVYFKVQKFNDLCLYKSQPPGRITLE